MFISIEQTNSNEKKLFQLFSVLRFLDHFLTLLASKKFKVHLQS